MSTERSQGSREESSRKENQANSEIRQSQDDKGTDPRDIEQIAKPAKNIAIFLALVACLACYTFGDYVAKRKYSGIIMTNTVQNYILPPFERPLIVVNPEDTNSIRRCFEIVLTNDLKGKVEVYSILDNKQIRDLK